MTDIVLTSWRDLTGVWHARDPVNTVTLCGLATPDCHRRGSRRAPTCVVCRELSCAVGYAHPRHWPKIERETVAPVVAIGVVDPPVRADGLCCVCLADRKPERSRRYAGLTAVDDPFCSNVCARAYFGVVPLSPQERERIAA